MISITNLTKTYRDHPVINNVSLSFPRNGLIAICGPSGCGKTTLLNCLSSLLDFEGEIEIDGMKLSSLSEKEKDVFRLKHMGFVFQDFKLFNSETVYQNVLLPLEMANNMKRKYKHRKVIDLLELVGLKHYKNHKINQLSGGEKQRIAIARALVNDPKIILADEPTGALDSVTGEEIIKVLSSVSKKSLVIVVSHDEDLLKRYASRIVHLKDGVVQENEYPNKESRDIYLPVFKNKETNKKPSIPSSFLLRHSLQSMKSKKGRTIIANMITSLGLIGVGLAVSLSSSISTNIKKTYASMIDESKIIMSVKEEKSSKALYSGSYIEAMNIANHYPDYVLDVGVTYHNDFESFFKTKNEFAIASTTYREPIENITARSINEFKWLDYEKPANIYPHQVTSLENDEVIFGLTAELIIDICFKLRIPRTIESLSDYLLKNDLLFYLDVSNEDWRYQDQQLFNMRGFTIEFDPCIYHSNHLWNEYIFETAMKLPSSDAITKVNLPWTLKKICYFHTFGNTDEFLIDVESSPLSDEFIFEIGSSKYFPWLYRGVDIKKRHRVLFFVNNTNSIPKRFSDILLDDNQHLSSPIYGSSAGYAFYPSNMLSGFSHQLFFSFDNKSLEQVEDENTLLNISSNEYTVLKSDVMLGHYSKTMQESVRFAVLNRRIMLGREPKNLDEIVVSSGLMKKLKGQFDLNNQILNLGYNDTEILMGNGYIKRTFINTQVNVVGIVDSSKYEIYHRPYWVTNFFKSRLGVSAFDLLVNSIAFSSKTNDSQGVIKKMNKAFPNYEIVNPMDSVSESVDQVCQYIEIALSIFSIVSILIASLLLTMCTYLHVLDSQKEIGLSRCLGVSKRESRKIAIFHTFLSCLISFGLSCVELFIVSFVSSYAVAKSMHSSMVFSFDIRGIIFMFVIAFVIALVSSLWVSKKVSEMNPLQVLKK